MKMDIKKILENHGITSVYHFTDIANLDTIYEFGLQPLRNIIKNHIPVNYFGAEELSHSLDQRKGLDRYVHLAFIKDHPMYHIAKRRGNLKNPVWIELDASILYEESTRFCDQVANTTGAHLFDINQILQYIDFDKMLNARDFNIRKEARKAEILAYNAIPTNYIKGVTHGN